MLWVLIRCSSDIRVSIVYVFMGKEENFWLKKMCCLEYAARMEFIHDE